jgi:hypothetical protein
VAGSRHHGDLDLLGTDWTGPPCHEDRSEILSATGKPAVAGPSLFGGVPIVIWWLTGLGLGAVPLSSTWRWPSVSSTGCRHRHAAATAQIPMVPTWVMKPGTGQRQDSTRRRKLCSPIVMNRTAKPNTTG